MIIPTVSQFYLDRSNILKMSDTDLHAELPLKGKIR